MRLNFPYSRILALGSASLFLTAFIPDIASAQVTSTMGGVVQSLGKDVLPAFSTLLVSIAYIVGLYLIFAGIMKLKAGISGGGARGAYTDALVRMFAGSFLLALPDTMGIGVATVLGSSEYTSNVSGATVGGVSDCTGTSGSSLPLTCIAQNIGKNFVPVMIEVIFGFCFMIGLFLILHGFYKMAQNHNEGRGQQDRGWKMELLVGFVLGNIPILMSDLASTLGFSESTITASGFIGVNSGASILSYTPPVSNAMLTQYASLIGWLFVILTLFGVWSFVQGWFILKAHADGGGRKTVMGGFTHIGAGVLLANAKISTCFIVGTMMGNGMGFC
jgi:hypothetical protein